jgi:hypothetical protein
MLRDHRRKLLVRLHVGDRLFERVVFFDHTPDLSETIDAANKFAAEVEAGDERVGE